MRHISKPELTPEIIEAFSKLDKKETFREFVAGAEEHKNNVRECNKLQVKNKLNETWFQRSKTALNHVYGHKCGFCEQEFDESNTKLKSTVEHFRPKKVAYYYWLAVEWTNLIPICSNCNNLKGDTFEVKNKQIKSPFVVDNQLDEKLFEAHELNLLEEPYLLHPEIDDPKEFLYYDGNANLQAVNERGKETIELLKLNDEEKRENLVLKRRRILDNIQKNIEIQLEKILQKNKEADADFLEIAFDRDFENIIKNAHNEQVEFTLLHLNIFKNFEKLVIDSITEKLTKNIDEELQLLVQENVKNILNNAFKNFLERSL